MRVDPKVWSRGAPPAAEPGHYAVLVCWDAIAGNAPDEIEVEDAGEIFPAALYWNGDRWDADADGSRTYDPVIRWSGPFLDKPTARTFAWRNEPGRQDEGDTHGQ